MEDLERGSVSVEFGVTPGLISALIWLAVEFRLRSAGRARVVIRSARLTEMADDAVKDTRSFDWLPLLSVGPAGARGPAPAGAVVSTSPNNAMVIHAVFGVDEAIAYGPYAALLPGRYQAIFDLYFLDAPEDAAIRADVVTDSGNRLLAEERIVPTSPGPLRCVLGFVIPEEALTAPDGSRVEFRIWSSGTTSFCLSSLRVVPTEHWGDWAVTALC